MRVTRSGKEFSGLTKAETEAAFEDHRAYQLVQFDLSSLIQPLHLKTLEPDSDEEQEPPLRQYNLRPRPPTATSYEIASLRDLAAFRPIPPPPLQQKVRPAYSPSSTRAYRKSMQKRAAGRTHRAASRLRDQNRLGTNLKAYQVAHVRETQAEAIKVAFNVEQSLQKTGAWTGPKDRDLCREMSLKEVMNLPGFRLIPNDQSRHLLFKDRLGRSFLLMAKPISETDRQALMTVFSKAMRECKLKGTPDWHRRGQYFTKFFGISFGGGQVHPANFSQSKTDQKAWDNYRESEAAQKLARRVSYLLKCYFPRFHSLYSNVLSDLCSQDPDLDLNFPGCCYASSSLNFERAVTVPHRDSLNLGLCAIYNDGTHDYKRGGHLIIWDLKLVIEFPPGCIAFLPSAWLRHSNTSIRSRRERRYSMTFFNASGLFRWRHNNFMSDKSFQEGATPEQRAKWEAHRKNLWQTYLNLLDDL